MDEFSQFLFQKIMGKSNNSYKQPITELEIESINKILKQKFETWDWIFGYSPKYIFKNNFPLSDRIIEFQLLVEKGIIRNVNSNTDQIENVVYHHAFDLILNAKHDYQQIIELLTNDSVIKNHSKFNVPKFCENLF
jgi:lipoate-protein ligase A